MSADKDRDLQMFTKETLAPTERKKATRLLKAVHKRDAELNADRMEIETEPTQ